MEEKKLLTVCVCVCAQREPNFNFDIKRRNELQGKKTWSQEHHPNNDSNAFSLCVAVFAAIGFLSLRTIDIHTKRSLVMQNLNPSTINLSMAYLLRSNESMWKRLNKFWAAIEHVETQKRVVSLSLAYQQMPGNWSNAENDFSFIPYTVSIQYFIFHFCSIFSSHSSSFLSSNVQSVC